MRKNPLINIKPKKVDQVIKAENFSNSKKTFLLSSSTIDKNIYDLIKSSFDNKNNLSLKDKAIVSIILKSYQKKLNNLSLSETEFVLTKNENAGVALKMLSFFIQILSDSTTTPSYFSVRTAPIAVINI